MKKEIRDILSLIKEEAMGLCNTTITGAFGNTPIDVVNRPKPFKKEVRKRERRVD